MKKILTITMAFVGMLSLTNCKKGATTNGGSQKLECGISYDMITKGNGKEIKMGDNLKVQVINSTMKDSVIFSSIKNGSPLEFKMTDPRFNGDMMHAFKVLHEGDSAVFYVSADSMFRRQFPPYAKAGDLMKFNIKVLKVMNEKEMLDEKASASAGQTSIDNKLIDEYVAAKKLDVKTTESGIRYIMEKEGTGNAPNDGDVVNVHYTGTLLDGTKFDSSLDRNEPFSFPLGQGRVIAGWDQGVKLFKKGGKGKLIIPSPLAYGERPMGPSIPANSVLIFEIELLDFKAAATE
jgi:peptidylprolyl isomerase